MLVLSCDDVPTNPLAATGRQSGIDVRIASFATTSDGEHVDNPRWGRQAGDRLTAAQQRLQRAKRGSKNRDRKRETVATRHRKIANQRKGFHHKQACSLIARYDLLVVEDLQIANMLRRAKPCPTPTTPASIWPAEQPPRGAVAKHQRRRLGPVRLGSARQSGRGWAYLD
jgi:putative transposase